MSAEGKEIKMPNRGGAMEGGAMLARQRNASTPPSLFVTRKEAAKELRTSLDMVDRAIAAGKLKAKKHGRSTVILRKELERYADDLPDA